MNDTEVMESVEVGLVRVANAVLDLRDRDILLEEMFERRLAKLENRIDALEKKLREHKLYDH